MFRGVAQLVARFVRDEEVGSSTLPTPTNDVMKAGRPWVLIYRENTRYDDDG